MLAWYMKQVETEYTIEFVAYGGEDSWFPGDALYIEEYPPENIVAAINIDGIGMKESKTAIAFFECPERLVGRVMDAAENYGEFVKVRWYAGDHGFFWPLGIQTLALTSSDAMDLLGKVIHTENDRPDLLDYGIIEQTATWYVIFS